MTWPALPDHYPSREIKFNTPYYTSGPTDRNELIEAKKESPPSTRIFYNEPLLRETTYMNQQTQQNPTTMMIESSRYDIFNPNRYPQNQTPLPSMQSSVVVDMRNARMSDNNFQVKCNNRQINPNLFDMNSTQDEIEIKDLMPSLNSKAYKNFNVIQHQHQIHHQNQHYELQQQPDYLNQIRQPNLVKEREGIHGAFNFKQQTGGEYVITKFQRRTEPEIYEENNQRIMKIPSVALENNSTKMTEINKIPQQPLITITPSDDEENLRINPAQRDSIAKKRKRDEFERFPFAASTQDMKNNKLVKTTPNDENAQPNIPRQQQGFQFKNQAQNTQQMSYLIPPKKTTLGRNIQVNLKKPEGKKVPSINTAIANNIKPALKSPKSPQNVKKIVSNTKKSKDGNNAAVDTRFDRFVYSRKKVPRTKEEGDLLQNVQNQADIKKKTLLTSQVIHPKQVSHHDENELDDSPKLLSESSTITGSFLTPKSAKLASVEDINESLRALVENSKLSTIRPIKVQKIEVIKKEETPGFQFVQAKVQVTHAEYKKAGSDEKGIFATTNLKTDVSFSELNQTGESDGGRLSEMIENLVDRKDSL